MAGCSATQCLLSGAASGCRRNLIEHRGPERRGALRYGDALTEPDLRGDVGPARRPKAAHGVLEGGNSGRQAVPPAFPLHGGSLLGLGVGASAAGVRLLL